MRAGTLTGTRTRTQDSDDSPRDAVAPTGAEHALVVAWAAGEPSRSGELLAFELGDVDYVFGRGAARADDAAARASLVRERPGSVEQTPALRNPFVSREQWKVRATADGVRVENLGKRPMLEGDRVVTSAHVRPGQTIEIKGQLLFLCVRRARPMPPSQASLELHEFGEPDRVGLVGESALAWQLRERVVFAAARTPHVLLLGASGTGKELVAQALHALSPRAKKRLVSRNAATFPAGLIDAELFGNAAGYPNAGMPERPGVVGEADGGTLFLDEIGELPSELQAHLLRFLDEKGEYQRLGDARRRSADVRVVAATNRAVDELKHDLAPRFPLRIELPSLDERLADVPLLARHLLRRIAARDPELGARFFAGWNGTTGEPRITLALVRALLAHRYMTNVRELESILWCALSTSEGNQLEATPELAAMIDAGPEPEASRRELSREEVASAMQRNGSVQERVWRDLGLANRYVLKRLLKKYGIEKGGDDGEAT